MDVDAYLNRIGLAQRPDATLAGLTALHRTHLLEIPYENLDVQLGRPVTLALEPIFEKVVTNRRGGWCYGMDGLLGWALGGLGVWVTRATGAVLRVVAGGVNALRSKDRAMIVITHYQRLLNYIVPDFIHVLYDGRIVKSGKKDLALELEAKGYDWIKSEVAALQ